MDALQSGASDQLAEARATDSRTSPNIFRCYVHIESSPPVRFIWANYHKTLAYDLRQNFTDATGKVSLPERTNGTRDKGVARRSNVIKTDLAAWFSD